MGLCIPTRMCVLPIALVLLAQCDTYDDQLIDGTVERPAQSGAPAPRCGDGQLDPEELCDTAIATGKRGACAKECPTLDLCEPNRPVGEACQRECRRSKVTIARDGDGCCPQGVGAAEDSDCGSCGDGVRGRAESCDPPSACVTPERCTSSIRCIEAIYEGDAKTCDATCSAEVITRCRSGDGCCAAGCTQSDDGDCSTTCGNGSLEPETESCDPTSPQHRCPTGCDDGDPCTDDLVAGSALNCSLACAHIPRTVPVDGDGCCATGANAEIDADCAPRCGNQVREGSERCDPCASGCDDGDPCTADAATGDVDRCDYQCTHVALTSARAGDGCCPNGASTVSDSDCNPVCGNALLETGEQCDGEPYCNGDCEVVFHPSIVHRYAFADSGTQVTDTAGSAHGNLVHATLDGDGKATLAGGTSGAYVDLPNGIIRKLTDATFEAWISWQNTGDDHVRVFDFGTSASGEDQQATSSPGYLYLTAGHDRGRHPRVSFSRDGSNDVLVSSTMPFPSSGMHHIAAVFNDSGNSLLLFVNGTMLSSGRLDSADHLAALTDDNNWLGRSQFSHDAPFQGVLHEFRIYSSALSAEQLEASYKAGPDP